jgi:hypothetical protein
LIAYPELALPLNKEDTLPIPYAYPTDTDRAVNKDKTESKTKQRETSSLTNIEAKEQTEVVKQTVPANAGRLPEKPPAGQGYPQQFEAFWLMYPRRNGTTRGSKADAYKVWCKLQLPEQAAASQMVAVFAGMDVAHKENGRWVVDAERWLRERRWETVAEEKQGELESKANGGMHNGNGHSGVPGRQFGTAKSRQSEASVREEMGYATRRLANELDHEITLGG